MKVRTGISKRDKINRLTGMAMVFPAAVVVLLMMFYPLVQVIIFSFSEVKLPYFDLSFVGLDNYASVLFQKSFLTIIANTLIWTAVSLSFRFILGFVSALIIDTSMLGKKAFRIIILLPWILPQIVTANIWRWLYNPENGLINSVLSSINPDLALNWLGTRGTALLSVALTNVWMGFPFLMLMLVAGMQGIPKDFTEAAKIDGANAIQVFRHITLPSLKNIIVILAILEFINGFNSFDLLFVMTGGGPGISSETLGLYIYRTAFSNFNFGVSSATGMILIIAIVVFFVFYVPSTKRRR